MSLYKEQIEHPSWVKNPRSHKWMKKQMNKFLRLKNKKIEDDDAGGYGKKETKGWEW